MENFHNDTQKKDQFETEKDAHIKLLQGEKHSISMTEENIFKDWLEKKRPLKEVSAEKIHAIQNWIDDDWVHQLHQVLKSGGTLGPILAVVQDNEYYVIDGHHRLCAYLQADYKTIPLRICVKSPNQVYKKTWR